MGAKKNRGRPRKLENKKRTVSISITPFQLHTLDAIATMDNCSRSEVLQTLIESAGYLKAGILSGDGIKPHKSEHQKWMGPKTGRFACNPHLIDGMCENQTCQAVYSAEGLL
jgi:hypothetical protein